MSTNPFVPPAAGGLPLAALDSATEGANALDAWAADPHGRNFLAHALVQLARDGWLRPEAGEGFEPVRERDDVPEPQDPAVLPAVPVPPTTHATLSGRVARGIAEDASQLRMDLYDDLAAYARQTGNTGLQHAQIRDHLTEFLFESLLRRMADEAQQQPDTETPASAEPLASGLPLVKGNCPACRRASLFLGTGGYPTCSNADCPEPDAATTVLEQYANEAHEPEHTWAAELHDPLADEWVPGTRYIDRDRAVNALAHAQRLGPTWEDGSPTQRRLVRATTTYTVEQPVPGPGRVADEEPAETEPLLFWNETAGVLHNNGRIDIPLDKALNVARFAPAGQLVLQVPNAARLRAALTRALTEATDASEEADRG